MSDAKCAACGGRAGAPQVDAIAAAEARGYAQCQADAVAWIRRLAGEHRAAADEFMDIAYQQSVRAGQSDSLAEGISRGEHVGAAKAGKERDGE